MSTNEDWLARLVQDLHLDDTIPTGETPGAEPVEGDPGLIGLSELMRRLEFTDKGWAAARIHLHAEYAKTTPGLFQATVDDNPDDLRMFLALIQAVYLIAKELRYSDAACERLGVFYALAFAVAIERGQQRVRKAMRDVVNRQLTDPRLWGDAETSAEATLQTELRLLHEAVRDDGR